MCVHGGVVHGLEDSWVAMYPKILETLRDKFVDLKSETVVETIGETQSIL